MLDPRTGEVLALVSLPTYDPNTFATGIDRATWNGLMKDTLKPLSNRALQGIVFPGSTFKIAVATAALEEGVVTPELPGALHRRRELLRPVLPVLKPAVTARSTCGTRSSSRATCTSTRSATCSGSIASTSGRARSASANGRASICRTKLKGLVPSTQWKQRVKREKWYAGETISVAIGQGQVSVTPLSLAVMMMTVANGGTRYTPHVLKAVDEGQGWKPCRRRRPGRS